MIDVRPAKVSRAPYLVRIVAFTFSSVLGLLVYLLVGGAVGAERPLWWGGEAAFPLLFGGLTLVVGSVVYYQLVTWLLEPRNIMLTASLSGVSGLVLGLVFQPSHWLVASVVTELPFWSTIGDAAQLGTGLALSGLVSSVIASLVIAFTGRVRSSRD